MSNIKRYVDRLGTIISDPFPLRSLAKAVIGKFELGNYESRLRLECVPRPHYGFCLYNAALLAKSLGYRKISVIEFGVANGDGLLNLEYHATQITQNVAVNIEVYGFDSGKGLPKPKDYRDLPYHWRGGQYAMNHEQLLGSLKIGKLIIGDIQDTLKSFFEQYDPAPIGAVSFDCDYYSSTKVAFEMFKNDQKYFLPRLFCYFDDTIGNPVSLMSDYTGERLAINEFNDAHTSKKFSKAYFFQARKISQPWHHKVWIYHDFAHPRYTDFVGD